MELATSNSVSELAMTKIYQPGLPLETRDQKLKRQVKNSLKAVLMLIVLGYFIAFVWLLEALAPQDNEFSRLQQRIQQQGVNSFLEEQWRNK